MKLSDVMSVDSAQLRTMDLKQLERIVKNARTYSNKRIRAIEQKGLVESSPAYQYYADKLKKANKQKKKMTRSQLLYALRLNQRFLDTQTSLVKGARSYGAKMAKIIPNVKPDEISQFWAVVDLARNSRDIKYSQLGSKEILNMFSSIWSITKSKRKVQLEMEKIIDEEYAKSNARYTSYNIDPNKFR